MKYKHFYLSLLFVVTILFACKKKDNIDTTYPEISSTNTNDFPIQCSTIKRGEKFSFKTTFTDNLELGSSSIDIHHNFDHHSHSTEVNACNMEAVKAPINPFVLIRTFPIAAGQKSYAIDEELVVPVDVDPGDYHFLIRVTDKAGWQTIKGISIKII